MATDHLKTHLSIFSKVYNLFPRFDEIFDEQTFYMVALIVTLTSILVAFILSRFITLKEYN